ncbi:MAG: hypothetical protein RTU92_05465 [Candidatus Thorarchaeota archaeon]
MIQATTNDVGTNVDWRSTGFFKRPFTVTHSSELLIDYPTDAVGTWTTNVTYGDLLLIILDANDTDSSVLVPGGTLGLNWVLGSENFDDLGNGQYATVVDTSLLSGKGQYTMSLTWTHPTYDTAFAQLTINVNYPTTLTSPDYPGISGPIGYDQNFTILYTNINGTGIIGGSISCNWSEPYTITPLGGGQYLIDLTTTGLPLGEYPVLIQASASYVEPASMLMYVEVREIYNTVSYSANQLSIPVGESDSFVITWTDSDNNLPITSANESITCNWTVFHSSGDQNYTVIEESPGKYRVTIFTKSTDPLTTIDEFYTVDFDIMRGGHQNHSFSIGVQIRSHNTLFVLDEPIQQTLYGSDIVVLVYFEDTDLGLGILNDTDDVKILVSSPGVSLSYTTSVSAFGDGHYNVTIPSQQWGSIGWKNLAIQVNWVGPALKYYGQTIDTEVRIGGTATDLYLELAPTATYFQDEFVFTAVYWDAINTTRISDPANVYISITSLTGGHSVTQSDFTIAELVSPVGTYEFRLDSSLLQSIGNFRFEIGFMWSEGVTPLHENQTMIVTLVVLERPTYIDYVPIQSTFYGETSEFSFSFVDALGTQKIGNSSNLIVSLNEGYVGFTLSYNSVDRTFTMSIDTTTLGNIGTYVLHLNMTWVGEPFYTSIESQAFTITVTLRGTQLSHLSFAPGQYGNNVSIEFVYTDLVASSSSGMTGVLTLNSTLAGWYSVTSLGSGHYLVEINTTGFASDGLYVINASIVYTGTYYASDAIEYFGFSVLRRVTQLGYQSPDSAPYLSNVSFVVSYVDDTTGIGIDGAVVTISCWNASSGLVKDTHYWVTNSAPGEYIIDILTTALGVPATYVINVTVLWSGAPFYEPANREVNSKVIERTTQILITQTPGDVPFLENVTFRFRFEDFLTGANIIIGKEHITLSHGVAMDVITSDDYALITQVGYYEISFNSTILSASSLVTGQDIHLTIDRSGGIPYYALRSKSTQTTTVERLTQILFPFAQDTPFGDDIVIDIDYIDYLSGVGIDDADLILTSINLTTPSFTLDRLGDGSYQIILPSAQFGQVGIILLDFTMTKSGVPFYAERSASNVLATIRSIQTSLTADTPAPGSIPAGAPMIVNLTFIDFDHGVPILNAIVTADWNQSWILAEIGGGEYRLTLNMTGLVAQEYAFDVTAEKVNYETEVIVVTVRPGAATVEVLLDRTTYFAEWGEDITIEVEVIDPFYGSPVSGMNVNMTWAGSTYFFIGTGDGKYHLTVSSRDHESGFYEPTVSVSYEFYQTRQKTFTLIVSRATGQIVPDYSVYYIVIDNQRNFTIYLNDTISNNPISDATVQIEWNNQISTLTYSGIPGNYSGSISVIGMAIGTYELSITGIAINHDFLKVIVDVIVTPIPTIMELVGDETSPRPVFGDSFDILVSYNESMGPILDASVSFTFGNLSGALTENPDGTYGITIDTSAIGSKILRLQIIAVKANYSTGLLSIVVNIRPIPTIIITNEVLLIGHYMDTRIFIFYFYDTHNLEYISGASLDVDWEGGPATVTSVGNGSYYVSIHLNLTQPRLYELNILFTKQEYASGTIRPSVILRATPAEIKGPASSQIPINDTATIQFWLNNTITGEMIPYINGEARWATGGSTLLNATDDGYYELVIPGDTPMGIYPIEIVFTSGLYSISSFPFEVTIRPVATILQTQNTTIETQPGQALTLRIQFYDSDHDLGISGVLPNLTYSESDIIYYPDYTTEEDGVYTFIFTIVGEGEFNITFEFSKGQYITPAPLVVTILSDATAEAIFAQNIGYITGIGLLLGAIAISLWVTHFSTPKLLRALSRMIKKLASGRVPRPAEVMSRVEIVLSFVNEELNPVDIQKELDDIAPEPIIAEVPEIDALLERLADITGLGETELAAFRTDLARMKASERTGFLKEVIEQEEARRADDLATRDGVEVAPRDTDLLEARPEELDEIRTKLRTKGMADSEIDVIIDQAKGLSKADLEALLESLGIRID